jgi:hypothetical protein
MAKDNSFDNTCDTGPAEIDSERIRDAMRLTGQIWHTLKPEDVNKEIVLRSIGILGPVQRNQSRPGECRVGLPILS